MKVVNYTVLIIALAFCACESQSPDPAPAPQVESGRLMPPVIDSMPATPVKSEDIAFLKEVNVSNINQYIHPKKGLWLVRGYGAMPSMEKLNQVDKNFPVNFSGVKNEELPKVDCATPDFWNKTGCFAQVINAFKSQKIWSYTDLSVEEKDEIAAGAETIVLSAINTEHFGRYYFSKIDGKWYLTFADLRMPCSV